MDQYKPDFHVPGYPDLMRLISQTEVRQAKTWAREAGLIRLES
jgi:uncharacterized Fe-S radical SAM superfamily protein PflX